VLTSRQNLTRQLNIDIYIQDKSYSRDWLVRGRIRVQLIDDDGKALVADIPSRESCTSTAYVLKCLAA